MRVASWDIGIKNLALCVVEQDSAEATPRVLRWELVHLSGKGLAEVVRSLFDILQARATEWKGCNRFLIERQAGLNRKMSVVSHCMQMWCLSRNIPASFCDPRAKLGFFEGEPLPVKLPNDKYARTKALAKWHVQNFLDRTHAGGAFQETLRRARKADDLSDALAQGLSWLNTNLELAL